MKKLFLHMGFPKTGTSSFQESCKKNIQRLEAQGFIYISIEKPDDGDMQAFFSAFVEKISHIFSLEKDVILSAESISSLNIDALSKLQALFVSCNFEIVPLLGVRSPYALLCSAKQQGIRAGYYREENFFPIISDRIKNIQSVFKNAQFFPYAEMCAYKDGLVAFLYSRMQIDYTDFEIVEANTSYSNVITRVQNSLNLIEPAMQSNIVNDAFVHIKDLESASFGGKYLLTQDEFAHIQKECEAENAFLQEHLGEKFCDSGIVFATKDPIVELCNGIIEALAKK